MVKVSFLFLGFNSRYNILNNKEQSGLTSAQLDFINETLNLHNMYRETHGVPPLVLNAYICQISQNWATRLADRGQVENSNIIRYGENIYSGRTDEISARECIDHWYSEIINYKFTEEPTNHTCSHFTQLVWKESRDLGVGLATDKEGWCYVVCNYYPPGNIVKHFRDNVLVPNNISETPKKEYYLYEAKSSKAVPQKEKPTTSKPLANQVSKLIVTVVKKIVPIAPKPFEPSKPVEPKDEFEADFLKAHNEYRKKHGVPPLYLTQKLNDFALVWAKKLAETGQMKHRDQKDYGESIFFSFTNDPEMKGNDPVDSWYSEIKDYNWEKEDLTKNIGHFTQIVWEDTKEVGLRMAKDKDGKIFVVANYNPPGNIRNKFLENVHKPKP